MMKLIKMLAERKMQLIFLLYILLFVPFASLIARNVPIKAVVLGIMASLGLLIAVFMLSSFMSRRAIRIFYSILLAFTLIPSAILLSYLLFANVLLSDTSITTLFETNPDESKEFVTNYMNPWVILGIAFYILFPVVMIFKIKHFEFRRIRDHKQTFSVCVVALLLCLAVEPVAQHIYFVDFYRIFADYKLRTRAEQKAIASRQQQPFDVALLPDEAPQTLVVVIGESLSRHHMSLYGYERQTNPQLEKRRNALKVFTDVTSPQVHTIPALRAILTFADSDNPQYLTERPSLFELFNRAGYETTLISNQPFEHSESSYEPLLRLADRCYDLSKGARPDGVVLPTFDSVLNSPNRKLIVIHLMGNHMVYKFRYPNEFDRFDHRRQPVQTAVTGLTPDALSIIDHYDNSVLYNDHLIASIIDRLEARNESCAMVYFSDHGEEIYDLRDFAGHVYEQVSTYMCEIPLILWASESFYDRRNDLDFQTARPYSTTELLYGLADIGGLRYEGYDERRSLFSPTFEPRTRMIGKLTYEEVVELTKQERTREANAYWAGLKNLKEKVTAKAKEYVL